MGKGAEGAMGCFFFLGGEGSIPNRQIAAFSSMV